MVLMGRLLKTTASPPKTLVQAMGYVLGPKAAEACQEELTKNKIQVPSPATLSRTRLKADVLLMRLRRQSFCEKRCIFVMLSCDASPQNGVDYQMTLEDAVERHRRLS